VPADAIYALLNAEAGAAFDELVRSGRHNELAGQGPGDRSTQLRASRFIPAVDYIRAQRVRTLLARQFDAMMSRVDVFVAPPDSDSVTMTNLTGHPAITQNAGYVNGMPSGVMLTGRLYDESTLLAAARIVERAFAAAQRRPAL
jgi:Asp-tRNA(Asn)/Glu-tRNA(Gln) amidotransferase A subunit family amidase